MPVEITINDFILKAILCSAPQLFTIWSRAMSPHRSANRALVSGLTNQYRFTSVRRSIDIIYLFDFSTEKGY